MPRYEDDPLKLPWIPEPGDSDEIAATAARLRGEDGCTTRGRTTAPIRLERDGNVASIVLSNPPLNLFGDDAWGALVSCIEEVEGSDARALVWRAEGDIFTGGVDVNSFKQGRRRRAAPRIRSAR